MFVAFIFMFIGVFFVIAFLAAAISALSHSGDPDARAEKLGRALKLVPGLFWGVGSFCFTFRMLMWYYGAISPTATKSYPQNHFGNIHYVNAALHHWMLGITAACFVGLIASVIIWTTRAKRKH